MKNNNKIFEYILFLFLIMPFFQISYLVKMVPLMDMVYKIWQVISGLIIIYLFIINSKYSKIINSIIVYLGIFFVSSIINNKSIIDVILPIFQIISLCLIIDYGIRKKSVEFIKIIENYLFVIIVINLLTILLYPGGMYINSDGYASNWFLGYKNAHILYILPMLMFSFIRSITENEKIDLKSIIEIVISIISTILVKNSTALVGMLIIIVLLLLQPILGKIKFLNLKSYFIVYLIIFFAIVIFRVQNIFEFLIVDILNKDLTFTGRTYIWDSVIELIKSKPILGYGNCVYKYSQYISTTHNTLLDILFKTGFIGLICYIFVIINTIKSFDKSNRLSYVFLVITISLTIMMLTEAYGLIYYMYFFVIFSDIKFIKNRNGDFNE